MNKNIIWKTISVIFNPMLAPLYFVLLYYLYTPELVYVREVFLVVVAIGVSTFVIPLLLIIILRSLKRVDSMELATADERRLPILVTTILLYVVHYKLVPYVSTGLMVCMLGVLVALIVTYISLWWTKISVHAMGIAGIITGMGLLFFKWGYPLDVALPVMVILMVAYDAVVMARMEMKMHSAAQIIMGTALGAGMQVAAFYLLPY